ncbi:MAG: restriction endonuclease [Deltaproteobacteria bacterium]|nr:restriction endonuclease [Deltaproteobacteria bacterium]
MPATDRIDGTTKRSKKWKLVEQIVAIVFQAPDVRVQKNVRLPALRRRGGRGGMREIDVLITGSLAGQPIHLAVECKHHNRRTDSPQIDTFVGKLMDVGLPTQTSIFVSTAGFTQPAVERAQEVGMRTLVLAGAEFSEAKDLIFDAIQSHVFMACALKELTFNTDEMIEGGSFQHMQYYDIDGNYKGSIADLLWAAWLRGTPPLICGSHVYRMEIPDDWKYLADGRKNSINNIQVKYEVSALTFQLKGEGRAYQLVDALTRATERRTLRVKFPAGLFDAAPNVFKTEEALRGFLSAPARASVTIGRIRLPKLIMNQGVLWPVPSTVIEQLMRLQPDDGQKEFLQFTMSAFNNFWDFDEVYAQVVRKLQTGLSISMKVQPM